jgi:hypothetical protein
MGLDDFADFASDFGDFATEAFDVASETLSDGFEYLSDGFDQLQEQVGSFAGDSEWFNTNNFGEIFGGPESLDAVSGSLGGGFFDGASDFFGELKDSVLGPELLAGPGSGSFGSILDGATRSVSDFAGSAVDDAKGFFSGLLNNAPIPTETGVDFVSRTTLGKLVDQAGSFVPSFDTLAAQAQKAVTQQIVSTGIRTAAGAINSQVSQIPVVGSFATGIVNRTAGAVNNAVNQQIGGRPITGPSLSQLTGITPNIGIPNVPGIQLASLGNNIPLNLLKTQTGTASVNTATDPTAGGAFVETSPGFFTAKEDVPADDPTAGDAFVETSPGFFTAREDVPPADDPNAPLVEFPPPASQLDNSASNVGYVTVQNPEDGTYYVQNEATGAIVASGLTEQQAILTSQDQTFIDAGEVPAPAAGAIGPLATPPGGFTAAQLNAIAAAQGVDAGDIDFTLVGPQQTEAALFAAEAATIAALRDQARQQQTIRAQRQNQAQSTDWRVRLRLAPTSDYLYNAPDCGPVLWPLRDSDGVIFPYTPSIDIGYKANYDSYDLIHSNYRGYFYKNSHIDQVQIKGTFTAQDTTEANYLLAVIHFFRSVTKMFYGQDSQRGSPPPLTYLSGLGDYQFSEHPCVVTQFNYNLPSDVNYIRAQSVVTNGNNLLNARKRQTVLGNPLSYALQRLSTVGMTKGGLDQPFAPGGSLGADNSTYVPTKMEISLTLLPMQSRSQVSKQFSLKGFANGNLLKGGFW